MKPAATPDSEPKPDPGMEAAQREATSLRLSHLFRRAGTDTLMQALWRAMVDYRTKK
jgi:hypothetical protein